MATVGGKDRIENMQPNILLCSCGFYLIDKGCEFRLIQDYLGARIHKHTSQYSKVAG